MKHGRLLKISVLLLLAIAVLSSCSFSSNKYTKACELFDAGKIYEAKNIFASMPDYENSSAYLAYIEASDKESSGEFAGAEAVFSTLGNFLDSETRRVYCAARQSEIEELYEDAEILYLKVPDYADSRIRIQQLPTLIISRDARNRASQYLYAQHLLSINDLDNAITAFSAIPHYEQSDMYLLYAQALQLAEKGELEVAEKGFLALGNFLDSNLQAIYYGARKAESEQLYEQADLSYQSIITFRDCAARHAAIPDLIRQREYDNGVAPFIALANEDIASADDVRLAEMLSICGRTIEFLCDPVRFDENDSNLLAARKLEASISTEQEQRIIQKSDAFYAQAVALDIGTASSEELAQAKQWCESASQVLAYNTTLHAEKLAAIEELSAAIEHCLILSTTSWMIRDIDTGKYGIAWADGRDVSFEWDAISEIDADLFLVRKDEKFGMVGIDGCYIIPCIYDSISTVYNYSNDIPDEPSILVSVIDPDLGERFGAFKTDGTQIFPCEYQTIRIIGVTDDRTYYRVSKEYRYAYALADDLGNLLTPEIWDDIEALSDGLFRAEQDDTCTFLNLEGKEAFPCGWDYVGRFKDGRAEIKSTDMDPSVPDYYDEAYGYIDTTGKVVIPIKWGISDKFSEGLAAVYASGGWRYIDTEGNVVIRHNSLIQSSGDFFDGFAEVSDYDAKIPVLINKRGIRIAENCTDYENRYLDGFVRVKEKGKWGLVDNNGKTAIPCEMNAIHVVSYIDEPINEQHFVYVVEKGAQSGIFNPQDGEVHYFAGKWDGRFFEDELLLGVVVDNLYGCIDFSGQIIVPCQYDWILGFNEGYGRVIKDGFYGYIDTSGEEIIPCTWDRAEPFKQGLALVWKNDEMQVIDSTGDVL